MQVIPAIDVLDGRVVRLRQGDFARSTDYGSDPVGFAGHYEAQGAMRLHLVDLCGAKSGKQEERFLDLVRRIADRTDLSLQVGGGIRTLRDVYALIGAGADRVVLGTTLFTAPELLRSAVLLFGRERIVGALDVCRGEVRIRGWQEGTGVNLDEALQHIAELGIAEVLITDIDCDGMEQGPNVDLYAEVCQKWPMLRITASGGIRDGGDIRALRRVGCSAALAGRALVSERVQLPELIRAAQSDLAVRVIPCLDVAGGRTVKGTKFQTLRDAGDPVELAKRYCEEGADELVFLDITATVDGRDTAVALASRVADAVNIPFTIGGGVSTVEDVRLLLEAGADKVAVNTAAVQRPDLLPEIAEQLGRANTVCAIDARRSGEGWTVLTRGGRQDAGRDAVAWAEEAAARGAGELLVTSFDRDGTGEGFDTELLASIKARVRVPVIASGGAGTLQDFVDAVVRGRADALLAASVFHFGTFSIRDVKTALADASLPIRS